MTLNRNGVNVDIYDTITFDQIEENDLVLVEGDQIEVTSKVDDGDSIMVKGVSFISGDSVTYIRTADTVVELWTE